MLADLADALIAARPGHAYRDGLSVFERVLFARALAATGGNQLKAARLLGLNRNTLRHRCRELGLWPSSGNALPVPASRGAPEPRRRF